MNSLSESIAYYCVKIFGALVRVLPVGAALGLGRLAGSVIYYLDFKRRHLAYTNLKIAFSKTKSPHELRKINKQSFQNFGQNFIELLRLPLMNDLPSVKKFVTIDGRENALNALKQGKGVILLANHFGNWELASKAGAALFEHPYKVIVNRQKKFSRLNELLNSYRIYPGSGVIERGMATRQAIKSLRANELVAIVVDQGGRDGTLVPFFDRQASMADGAIRMALRMGTPVCFVNLVREKGPYHRLYIHEPFKLIQTGDQDQDVEQNLLQVTRLMEKYIREYPAAYMWFYKIWKYSKESVLVVLNDGKTGHLRQSQTVAAMIEKALSDRGIGCSTATLDVNYKNTWSARVLSLLSLFTNGYFFHGHLGFLRWFLEQKSFEQVMSLKADVIVSCGSSLAGINNLLAGEQQAKSIVILKPGLLPLDRFDLVILPQHDQPQKAENVVITKGAPNLITPEYLEQQSKSLLNRYSHLKLRGKLKIGVLIGGDTKDYFLSEPNVKLVLNQIREVADEINADILLTTSRRTSERVENMLQREIKKLTACQLFISANRNNVPEAVGGILGLSDLIVVSGDSISMISEAASSGKNTIVFPVQNYAQAAALTHKHHAFIDQLNADGYIVSVGIKDVRRAIYDVAKNKIKTRKLNDHAAVLDAVRKIL